MSDLVELFRQPTAEYSAVPFWFWNGDLDPDELLRQLRLMRAQGIQAVILHARKGLEVPYLSETWFERCDLVLAEATRLGMRVWVYDEDNWPSGYAGGRVLARNASYAGQNLTPERHYVEGPAPLRLALDDVQSVRAVAAARIAAVQPLPPDPLAFNQEEGEQIPWDDAQRNRHLYAEEAPQLLPCEDGIVEWQVPAGYWCLSVIRQGPTHWIPAYGDTLYVDLANADAMDAFIEETHEQYYRRFAEYFGNTFQGFFVDEPGFYNNFWDRDLGSITWTHDFAEQFQQRRGYDLLPWLPALWENLGARGMQVRYDYWLTVAELIQGRFFQKLADWCQAHGVRLTGHLHWEEWLFEVTRTAGSPFMALQPFHLPGVDRIDEVYAKLSEKLVSSIAHANGRRQVLSETFAVTGWKLAPPYMKRIVDWQFVRGINVLNPHGFYYSIADYRRRECPPSEFFQNPWWPHSGPLWSYVARLSAALAQGQHVAPVALYYPSEQAWATMTPDAPHAFDGRAWSAWQLPEKHVPVIQTDLSLFATSQHLLENQLDFDLVDHTVLASATVEADRLHINQEQFAALVVPKIDVLAASSLEKLLAFARAGGTVVFVNQLPAQVVNGAAAEGWDTLRAELGRLDRPGYVSLGAGQVGYVPTGVGSLARLLRQTIPADVEVEIDEDDDQLVWDEEYTGMQRLTTIRPLRYALKYCRRSVPEAGVELYFLVNESDRPFQATLQLAGGPQVEEWLPRNASRRSLPAESPSQGHVSLELSFGPWESRLLCLGATAGAQRSALQITATHRLSEWHIQVGERTWENDLSSWSELGLAQYAGTGTYSTSFEFPYKPIGTQRVMLDLGTVLETAQVTVNGIALTPLAWPPYSLDITYAIHAGHNELEVQVANTNVGAFEGQERPSGLLGPVYLILMN